MSAAWFRALQTVQGVGARIALAVLGTLSTSDLANAVALGDKGAVSRAPGVGPKVAMRIVAELKDKMPTLAPAIVGGGGFGPVAALPDGIAAQDAVSALTNLGYGHAQAAGAISAAIGKVGRDARPEELIRLGLRELALREHLPFPHCSPDGSRRKPSPSRERDGGAANSNPSPPR